MIKKLIPILFIIFIWLLFAKPFLIDNKIPFPSDHQLNQFSLWSSYPKFWGPIKNPAQPDVITQIMPWKKLTIDSLKDKQIPFWNPYSFSGTPHFANYQSSSFSVTNILYFFIDFNNAWSIAVLIQPLLAGIFTYLFTRSLKKSEYASILASISFMFCGFITTWMSYATLALAISFLPLALFSIEKYSESKKTSYLILLSLTIPLSFFSGHFQISIYFFIFVISYIFFKLYETRNKTDFIYHLSFSFFGILLSLPQILPSIELYLNSYRSSVFQKIEAVPIKYLPTIIAPDFYGSPVTRNNIFNSYAEWSSFIGAIPFLLSVYALSIKSKKVIFFFTMAVLALLFSIDTPILDSLIKLRIPVISTSSAGRILVITSFSLAILSAFGLDKIRDDIINKEKKKILIWIIFYILLFSGIWGLILSKLINPESYQLSLKNMILPSLMLTGFIFFIILSFINKKLITLFLILVIILTCFDMLRFTNKWQAFSLNNSTFTKTPIINKLQSYGNINRTIGAFGAEGAVYFQIPGTEGYDPLYINRYGEFIGSLTDGKISPSPRSGVSLPVNSNFMPKVFDLMGIKYVLLKKSDENKAWAFPFKKYPNKFNLVYKENEFSIYENKAVYPRAFLVGNYVKINEDQEIINKILDNKFDLRKSVVVESDPNIKIVSNLVGTADIVKYSPNKIEIKTISNNDSLLVLTDNYYPGWKVKINGIKKDIIRTNYTFRAVAVTKGNNNVEFYFESASFKLGLYLAGFSIISMLIVILFKFYSTRLKNKKNTNH